jgi:hypothetical protein
VDLSDTIVPRSDQLNAEDLLTGPHTVTISDVRRGSADQPVDVHLVEFPGRPFKPSKTVRRILVAAWGQDANVYLGRRMTLYRDPAVRFGGLEVGGIRVSHLSHISAPLTLALTVTRGRRAPYVVQPLAEVAPPTSADPASREQLSALQSGLAALGYADRPAIYAVLTRELGRPITSSEDFTGPEAQELIDRIRRRQVPAAAPPSSTPADDPDFVPEPPADWQPEDGPR